MLNSCLHPVDQLQDLSLHRHIESRGGLVGDQQVRVVHQSHRDHRSLTHTARVLVWIVSEPLLRPRDADGLQHVDGSLLGLLLGHLLVALDRLDDLIAHPVEGMETGERVLEDHRQLFAADAAQLVLATASAGPDP